MPYIAQVADGWREHLNVFGNVYKTVDGTGARNCIYIVDLLAAHIKALQNQLNLNEFEVINIGIGKCITVLELIKSFEEISGISINYRICPRQSGDLPAFWANQSNAFELLGWKPKNGIEQMCKDTWWLQRKNLRGYS